MLCKLASDARSLVEGHLHLNGEQLICLHRTCCTLWGCASDFIRLIKSCIDECRCVFALLKVSGISTVRRKTNLSVLNLWLMSTTSPFIHLGVYIREAGGCVSAHVPVFLCYLHLCVSCWKNVMPPISCCYMVNYAEVICFNGRLWVLNMGIFFCIFRESFMIFFKRFISFILGLAAHSLYCNVRASVKRLWKGKTITQRK